jgi:hypothetical protein
LRLSLLARHPLHLVIGNGDVLLSDAEKAAHTDHDRLDLALAVNNDLVDVADLLIVAAIDINAHEL